MGAVQDDDDGNEVPPEAPPTPSDDMDLGDRSPEPGAPAAEPEPELEPALPDMELESPTRDEAPPAPSLAGEATHVSHLKDHQRPVPFLCVPSCVSTLWRWGLQLFFTLTQRATHATRRRPTAFGR